MNEEKILEIIKKYVKNQDIAVTVQSDFKNDLHLDSIDLFQIITDIETDLGIQIETEKLLDIHNVSDAIKIIQDAK